MVARKASPSKPSKAPARKADTKPVKTAKPTARKVLPVAASPKPPAGTTGAAPAEHPGFIGSHTDPTPNEHYSIQGVIGGLPVPEHDK